MWTLAGLLGGTVIAWGATPWVTPDAWIPVDDTVVTVHLQEAVHGAVQVRLAGDGIHPPVWQEAVRLRDPLTGAVDQVQVVVPAGSRAGWYDLEVEAGGLRTCAPKALAVVPPGCGLGFATFPREGGPFVAEDLGPLDEGRACAAARGADGVIAVGLGTAGETLDYLRPTHGDRSLSLTAYDLSTATLRTEAAVDHLGDQPGPPLLGGVVLAAPPPTWPRSPAGVAAGATVVAAEGCPGISLEDAHLDELQACIARMPLAGVAWTVDRLSPSEALDEALERAQATRVSGTFATVAEWVGDPNLRPPVVMLPLPGPQTDLPHRQLDTCGRPEPFVPEEELHRGQAPVELVVGVSVGGGPLDHTTDAGGWVGEGLLDLGLRHPSGAGLAVRGGRRDSQWSGVAVASWRVHDGPRGDAWVGGMVGPSGVGVLGSMPLVRLPGELAKARAAVWLSGERGWLAADPMHVGIGLRIAHHHDLEAK